MRLLADMHISPRTVDHLQASGRDVVRVSSVMPATSSDVAVIAYAVDSGRCILTQDLDFSRLVAASGMRRPSVLSLRLSSARADFVNAILDRVLPQLEEAVAEGAIISIADTQIRQRLLPVG